MKSENSYYPFNPFGSLQLGRNFNARDGNIAINTLLAKNSNENAADLMRLGYRVLVISHFHYSGAYQPPINENSYSSNSNYKNQLWEQDPTEADKKNVANRKTTGINATHIQISSYHEGEAHFYDEKGTYLSMPLKVLFNPLPKPNP